MVDRDMVLACVLARLQAEGRNLKTVPQSEIGTLIVEAIADLRLAQSVLAPSRRKKE